MTNMPYGAIDSVDFLRSLLNRTQNGESITLYGVHGHHFDIWSFNLTDQSQLKAVESFSSQSALKLVIEEYREFHLNDYNVGGGRYNLNYIFIDEELAKDYIRYLREYRYDEIQQYNQHYNGWDDDGL